ncbi:MAG TPA: hypothetical protein VFZ23_01435 [Pyrinomonadaceae bacterium]
MKILTAIIVSTAILLAVPFTAPVLSSGGSSIAAQSVAKRTKRKGRYGVRRTWNGTKWVTTKVRVGTKSPRRKTWRTGRKVVSRTKKVIL